MGSSSSKASQETIEIFYPAGKEKEKLTFVDNFPFLPIELVSYIFHLLLTDVEVGNKQNYLSLALSCHAFAACAEDTRNRSQNHMQELYAVVEDSNQYVKMCKFNFSAISLKSKPDLINDVQKVDKTNPSILLFKNNAQAKAKQTAMQYHGFTAYMHDEIQPTLFKLRGPHGYPARAQKYKLHDFFREKAIHYPTPDSKVTIRAKDLKF